MQAKTIHQFKKGDIVHFHGARFEILEDARESQGHRPQAGHPQTARGPCDCAVAKSICIDGLEGLHKAQSFYLLSQSLIFRHRM